MVMPISFESGGEKRGASYLYKSLNVGESMKILYETGDLTLVLETS